MPFILIKNKLTTNKSFQENIHIKTPKSIIIKKNIYILNKM